MKFVEYIASLLIDIWDEIKKIVRKIYVAILNFLEHIRNFFFNLKKQGKLKANQKALTIKVKELLKDKSKYNTVDIGLSNRNDDCILNVVLDEETGLDIKNAELIEYSSLDSQTREQFGNKPMVVLT
jgi:hypothetical protein